MNTSARSSASSARCWSPGSTSRPSSSNTVIVAAAAMRGSSASTSRPRSVANARVEHVLRPQHVVALAGAQALVGVDHLAPAADVRRRLHALLDHRGDPRPQRVGGRLARGALVEPPLELGHLGVGVGEREVLLGREVARHGARRDVGRLGDLGDRGVVEPLAREQLERGLRDRLPCSLTLALAQPGGLVHAPRGRSLLHLLQTCNPCNSGVAALACGACRICSRASPGT